MAASATDLPLTDACGALVGDHPQCTILLPECNIHLVAAFSSHFRRENVVQRCAQYSGSTLFTFFGYNNGGS